MEKEKTQKASKLANYKPHNGTWRGQPDDGQEAFHKSDSKIRLLVGANQCLAGSTKIYDPFFEKLRRVSEIEDSFFVYAWNGETLVAARACKPFVKGEDKLYRVALSNGKQIVCTLSHRILTPEGFCEVRQLREGSVVNTPSRVGLESQTFFDGRLHFRDGFSDDALSPSHSIHSLHKDSLGFLFQDDVSSHEVFGLPQEFFDGLLASNAGYVQSTHVEDGRSSFGREQGFQCGYRFSDNFYDEQFHVARDVYRDVVPLQGDVLKCNQLFENSDGRGRKLKRNHIYQQSSLPSSSHVQDRACRYVLPDDIASSLETSFVEEIKFVGVDKFYDFTVPIYHNYQDESSVVNANSGKTIAGAIEFIWRLLGIHPHFKTRVPVRGRIIASLGFEEGANQVIVPKLLEWMPEKVIRSKRTNPAGVPAHWELTNGSVFDILSGEQDEKVFEGWTGDIVWVDEPPKKTAFDSTRRGLMRNRGHLWLTLTPLAEPWLYQELWQPWVSGERTDISCHTIDIFDNCVENGGYLEREAIEEYAKDLDPSDREARLHGKFRHLMGRVYPDFEISTHVIDDFKVPFGWPVYGGIDPHQRKEHAFCMWTIDPMSHDIIVCGEIYEKITIPELAMKIKELIKGKSYQWTLIDTSSETPDAMYRITPRRILEQHGVPTRLAKKYNNISHGIHLMKALLKPTKCNDKILRPQFKVMRSCRRHISEFMNYVYDERDTEYMTKDTPRKTWDDFMDLDRYFVVENPSPEARDNRIIRTQAAGFSYAHRGL